MTQMWRCDSCHKPHPENELIEIVDSKGIIWFRCSRCRKKWGDEPRSHWCYTSVCQVGPVLGGFEDPDNAITYGPND